MRAKVMAIAKKYRRPKGGRQPGAGRPVGAATEKTRDVANKIMRDGGVTPLEALVDNMRYYYGEAQIASEEFRKLTDKTGRDLRKMTKQQRSDFFSQRSMVNGARINMMLNAKEAAPFVHAKLQSTTLKGDKKRPLIIQLLPDDIEDEDPIPDDE